MPDLDTLDLYQEILLDHNRAPRNFGALAEADCVAEGYNPLCGDRVKVYVDLDADGAVSDVRFEGSGCAISTASASLMTESVKGLARPDVLALFDKMIALVTGDATEDEPVDSTLGKLAVFQGVREFPMRVKCATLAWHTLRAALTESGGEVSTEE